MSDEVPDICNDGESNDGFLDDPDVFKGPGDRLPEGVKKEIITEGKGTKYPKAEDEVTVHYVGSLEADGSEFDSSRGRDKPFVFTLGQGQVIKGWDLGVATMREGEKAKFTLMSEFAYGEAGSPPQIPGGATLVFEVELLSWVSQDDLFQDGGVIKTQLKESSHWKKPEVDDEVQVDLKVVTKEGETIDEKKDFEYVLGSEVLGSLSKAVDMALSDMSKGGEVQLQCSKDYACGEKTPNGATVTLALHQVYETLDVSLAKDKSLMKKQVVEGEGWEKPKDCAKVKVKVEAATDGTKALPGFSPKTLEFISQDGEVCDAIECAVREMKLNEKAAITCIGTHLVSEVQLGLQDVSAQKVVLTLELLEFEKVQDTWNMDEEEKVVYGTARKDVGSKLFRAGRTHMALERYKKVITLFASFNNFKDEDSKKKAQEVKKICELNSAACQLKFKDFAEVKKLCDAILKDDSSNAKALFRRAQAHLGLEDFASCIADVKKHIEVEPQSREARSLLKEAHAGQKVVDNKSKGLFGKMCGALGKGPIPEPGVIKSFMPPDRPPPAAEVREEAEGKA